MTAVLIIVSLVVLVALTLTIHWIRTVRFNRIPEPVVEFEVMRASIHLHQARDRLKTFEARCEVSNVKREAQRALRQLDEMKPPGSSADPLSL